MPDLKRWLPDHDTCEAFRLSLEGGIVGTMIFFYLAADTVGGVIEMRQFAARARFAA